MVFLLNDLYKKQVCDLQEGGSSLMSAQCHAVPAVLSERPDRGPWLFPSDS